jgi:hypothetical protein
MVDCVIPRYYVGIIKSSFRVYKIGLNGFLLSSLEYSLTT